MSLIATQTYKDMLKDVPQDVRRELEDLKHELQCNRLSPARRPMVIQCRTGETLHIYRVNRIWRLITYWWKEDETLLLLFGIHDKVYQQAKTLSIEQEEGLPIISVLPTVTLDTSRIVHVATPELLTTIRKALGETLEVFALRFLKPDGTSYDAGSMGVYSTGASPISDSVDAAFCQALPALLQDTTTNLDGRPAVLAAIMENVHQRREALGLSIQEFADLIGYPVEAYRQVEGVYIHKGVPRRCTTEYLIPILLGLSALEAGQNPVKSVNEETIAERLDELEATVGTLRQTVAMLSETLAALREAMGTK